MREIRQILLTPSPFPIPSRPRAGACGAEFFSFFTTAREKSPLLLYFYGVFIVGWCTPPRLERPPAQFSPHLAILLAEVWVRSEWYPAVVTGVNEWGMLALRYSDGDTADNVPSCHVRPRVKRAKEM